MGDRGNIVMVNDSNNQVWFYTHWRGSGIKSVAQCTLAKKKRWNDFSYLARMVFTDLIDGDTGETGFGISTTLNDNSHDILVIDVARQRVGTVKEKALITIEGELRVPPAPDLQWSFKEFIAAKFD